MSDETLAVLRFGYAVLLAATLASVLPQARRFLLSERWGGYGDAKAAVTAVQNPRVLPVVLAVWLACAVGLAMNVAVPAASAINLGLCWYFFVRMRWCGLARGLGAPGFMTYWLAAAVFLLECARRFAPQLQPLALLTLQCDLGLILLSSACHKLASGYARGEGMEYGLVNPQWGRWWRWWMRRPPGHVLFAMNNHLAWSSQLAAGVLLLCPATRGWGAALLALSFVYIASQIRLGFLCEMMMLCGLLFVAPGTAADRCLAAVNAWVPNVGGASVGAAHPLVSPVLGAFLACYLAAVPLVHAGLSLNYYGRRALPGRLQAALERYANFFGILVWRVFSADHTNFFIRILRQRGDDGPRTLLSHWGERGSGRFCHVCEAITVTTLFNGLKYHPSDRAAFERRLLRYARTLPRGDGPATEAAAATRFVFEYVRICKDGASFAHVPVREFVVEPDRAHVMERVLDDRFSPSAVVPGSPAHTTARPGTYVPTVLAGR